MEKPLRQSDPVVTGTLRYFEMELRVRLSSYKVSSIGTRDS